MISWAQLTVCQDLLLGYFMEQFVECFVVFHKALQRDERPTLKKQPAASGDNCLLLWPTHVNHIVIWCIAMIKYWLVLLWLVLCCRETRFNVYLEGAGSRKQEDASRTYVFVDEPIWMLMVLLCYGLLAGQTTRNNVIGPSSKFSFFSCLLYPPPPMWPHCGLPELSRVETVL